MIEFWLLPIALVLLAGLVGLRVGDDRFPALRLLPESRFAPHAVAFVAMLVIWYVWGSLRQVPVFHDEASYLLQAETFARGRWVMPSPPLPEFFEQFHVFVTPTFSSKYPPGHAILLVPGIWLGLPGLVPLLLNGLAAALLFILVRRVTNGWVAVLTVVLWLPMSTNLIFRPTYFSETTSSVLWLLGWWGLLEWRDTRREKWLIVIAVCTGWMAITRPLTALAFAIPVGIVVIWQIARTREWRQLIRPGLVGVAIVALLPVSSAQSTGSWRVSPYSLYAKDYLPFDKLGFGLDTTPPERALPPDMRGMAEAYGPAHEAHTPRRLPRVLYDRWHWMFVDAFRGSRLPLAIFAIGAIAVLPAAGWFAVGGSILLTLCYLGYAHEPSWSVYYLEIIPLFPFLAACGVWAVWIALWRRGNVVRNSILRTTTPQAALAGVLICVLWLVPARRDVMRAQRGKAAGRTYQVSFTNAVAKLPEAQTIIFIRYAPEHPIHTSLIANKAHLPTARTWFVYDRGAENAALIALAPKRAPYLFDERSGTLKRLRPPGS
ncbi:MAG: glycosyltransferase family 39 protein [Anaerolineae bacterium]|nr:glycosyltransferase family 39 protein [Gemmatimonadaceae bacterium]